MKNRVDILTQHYFPFHFIILGVVFLLMAILTSLESPLLATGFFLFGLIFTTTHFRLMLDVKLLKFKEYLWILGYKKGIQLPLERIKYIYINKIGSKTEYGIIARLSATNTIFKGFIKLSNDDAIFVGESTNEKKLLKKIKNISETLNVEIRKNYQN